MKNKEVKSFFKCYIKEYGTSRNANTATKKTDL